MAADETPLCVDLDGTLIAGDTLILSLRQIAIRAPWKLARIGLTLFRGRAGFKEAVADAIVPNPAAFPWRPAVVSFVRSERERGRRVFLTTAADRRIAESVAAYLGCFDGIVASDGTENTKGTAKVDAIRRLMGDGATSTFDYIGDSAADLPIFAAARFGYLVAPTPALRQQAAAQGRIERIFE